MTVAWAMPAASAGIVAPPPAPAGDVVVTARRGPARPAGPDAVLRTYCHDPLRWSGRFLPPADEPGWRPLAAADRARLHLSDAGTAYVRRDEAARSDTVVAFDRFDRGGGVVEQRCTVVAIGGLRDRALPGRLSALFGGGGTRRHVGRDDGAAALPDWEQWLWTGAPARGSRDWRTVNAGAGAGIRDTWVVVTDRDGFYRDHDYVLGDLKVARAGDRPTVMLSLAFLHRE